jgi:hypothetical protein
MPKSVLLPVLIQDPEVLGDEDLAINPIQPVVARDPTGFWEGPACERVAIVDIDTTKGSLRPVAVLDPKGSLYANVGAYLVTVPLLLKRPAPPWVRRRKRSDRSMPQIFSSPNYDDPFLKVSVFGTVLRTIAFIEHRVALDRRVKWAFEGEQLLVVPRAGEVDNAFYHRGSQSIQLYYFAPRGDAKRTVYSGLSQDIVAHETAHALIDGIAPHLYDAVSPESLGIHEAIADLTAVLISLRNRELLPSTARRRSEAMREVHQSSRFSRIAEEFGRWRGHGESLRDVNNDKTLDPKERDPSRRVDRCSPHSVSEVLSGALFGVLRRTFEKTYETPPKALPKDDSEQQQFRNTLLYTINRIASLIFKGLDWLPPGEVSFADYIRAMLAADQYYCPDILQERSWLIEECQRRYIFSESGPNITGEFVVRDTNFDRLAESVSAQRRFLNRHRISLGIPTGKRICVFSRLQAGGSQRLFYQIDQSEIIDLGPHKSKPWLERPAGQSDKLLVIKVFWWDTEPNELGEQFGDMREFRRGATIVMDSNGAVRELLRCSQDETQSANRNEFLRGLAMTGGLLAPGRSIGPEGKNLQGYLHSTLRSGVLRVSGGFQALHIAEDLT